MGQLLPVHKIIIAFSTIGVVLALCLHIYVTEPAGQDYENLSGEVSDLRKQLRTLKAPGDEATQDTLRTWLARQQSETKRLGKQVLELYMSTYKPVVEQNNWSLGAFVRQSPKPTRDFYMKEFDRIIRDSPYGDLSRGGDSLGLSRDSDAAERYQLLLQLWCVESLLNQAQKHQLELVWDLVEGGDKERSQVGYHGRRRKTAPLAATATLRCPALRMLPTTVLESVQGKKTTSEFLELRFRLGLKGKLSGIEGFVRSLSSAGTFFGIGAFEVMQLPPRRGTVAGGELQLNVECVTYVPLTRP